MLQATAWYEPEVVEGDGGWVNFNGNNVPSNYNEFLNNNSMTTIILDDEVSVGGEGDFLGAFYEGELRGVVAHYYVGFGPYVGTYQFPIMMFSNESGGDEVLNFKLYDASKGVVSAVVGTYAFNADDPQGDFATPIALDLGLEWYEPEVTPGDGGWVNFNGNNVPANYNEFLNNNSAMQ